jgi:hypothetical protein
MPWPRIADRMKPSTERGPLLSDDEIDPGFGDALLVPIEQETIRWPENMAPHLKIELRISCCEFTQGIEVPVGSYLGGRWSPYVFTMDDNKPIDAIELARKLILQRIGIDFEHKDFDAFEQDVDAALFATVKRCLLLAKAKAAKSKTRSRCKRKH